MSRPESGLERITPLVDRYLEQNEDPSVQVVRYLDPGKLERALDLRLGDGGTSLEELLPAVESYLRYSVRTGKKTFLNQLYGGFSEVGFLGDVVTSLTNTSMYTFEVAPVATLMELELIRTMLERLGFASGEGTFCTGGSNANLIAVLCARERSFPEIRTAGVTDTARRTLFVSDQAHYSFLKAANQLGIGTDNVRPVSSDADGRMITERLDAALAESRERGERPFFVGATAGTTVLGAFDPLDAIARICRKHDVWFHVDGSWGGPVVLSRRHRHLLSGADQADSFSWDAHKLMGASLMCAAFLTRHEGILGRACSIHGEDADYLFHGGEESAYDFGRRSLQCGRRVDALKLWLMWKHHGDAGWSALIDRLFDLARLAARRIDEHERLERLAPTPSLNVCFRYVPDTPYDLDRLNLAIRERLRKTGRLFLNYSRLRGNVALRLIFTHPDLNEADVARFLATVAETGDALSREQVERPVGARSTDAMARS